MVPAIYISFSYSSVKKGKTELMEYNNVMLIQENMQQQEQHRQLEQLWFDLTLLVVSFQVCVLFMHVYLIHILQYWLIQTLSTWSTSSVEEVASTGPGIRFFQLYVSLKIFPHLICYFIKFS